MSSTPATKDGLTAPLRQPDRGGSTAQRASGRHVGHAGPPADPHRAPPRDVHADGSLLAGHERAALAHYATENTPLRHPAGGGLPRIDMRRARFR